MVEKGRAQRRNAPVLRFTAGGLSFGVFVAEVGRLVLEDAITPVPFAHRAMAGLLDSPESPPAPVFDLRGLTTQNPPPVHVPGANVALFSSERGPVGLRMDTVVGSRSDYLFVTSAEEAAGYLGRLPEAIRPAVTAVGESPDGHFYFFSPDGFLARLDIAQAARPALD